MSNDEAPDETYCPECGGPGKFIGTLGTREHFRCRDCGMDFSNALAATSSSMADSHIQTINAAIEQLEQWIEFVPEAKRGDFERLVHAIWSANRGLEQGDWT